MSPIDEKGTTPPMRRHTRHPRAAAALLDWTPCRRGDAGAVWTGARWTCPPFGPGEIVTATAGIVAGAERAARRAATQWRPWWERDEQPGPNDPVTVFRGTPDGVEIGLDR